MKKPLARTLVYHGPFIDTDGHGIDVEPVANCHEELVAAIERALADSESGNGWGPDVTVCAYLRAALAKAINL